MINRRDLGYVRLWQDELAEIIRLMRQLDGADVHIEVDDYVIDDIEVDLPKIGSRRVKSFKATATRATDNEPPHEFMKIELSKERSQIEAGDPNLSTLGAMEAIVSLTDRCRRIPAGRLTKFFGSIPGTSWFRITGYSVAISVLIWLSGILAGDLIVDAASPHSAVGFWNKNVALPRPIWTAWAVLAALLCVSIFIGFIRARTVLYTGTRAEAPTWWQEHRSDVAINVAVSVVFFLLGILFGHL